MTALAAPVFSSRTRVVPGIPRVSPGTDGTETTLTAVPMSAMRAGMKRARCDSISSAVRWGAATPVLGSVTCEMV